MSGRATMGRAGAAPPRRRTPREVRGPVAWAAVAAGLAAAAMAPLAAIAPVAQGQPSPDAPGPVGAWPQWGGPQRTFVAPAADLADAWPADGPRVLWSRELGVGHSAIVTDGERLYTMARAGDGRARQGPWAAEEFVVALDARTGETVWRHAYPSRVADFSFGAGPHATPLLADGRLFAFGTNKQVHAFDARTGRLRWARDLVAEGAPELLVRPVVKAGYGCSPIAWRDTIICAAGGPGQSVIALRQRDGTVAWRSGHFLTSEADPILIGLAGRTHLVVLGGGGVHGLDPDTGRVLWTHPHDPGNDLNCGTPLWYPEERILFVSSAYRAGSRAIRLVADGSVTRTEELWFTSRVRFMFLNALRLGEYVYGTSGDFGPAFLTALNLRTGEPAWQHRGFARASLVQAGDRTVLLDEDGTLALLRLSPEGVTVLAQAKIFETTAWTTPTLVGATLYARDRERIVALDLGGPAGTSGGARLERLPATPPPDARGSVAPPEGPPVDPEPWPSFSGTWRLDAARSALADGLRLAGMTPGRGADTLHITHAANGALLVESQINAGHARFYVPGARTTTPAGQSGTVTMEARWDGARLVAEGRQVGDAGTARAVAEVREVFTIAPDGALVIAVTSTAGGETRRGTLVYRPLDSLGPCETWATPCKR